MLNKGKIGGKVNSIRYPYSWYPKTTPQFYEWKNTQCNSHTELYYKRINQAKIDLFF